MRNAPDALITVRLLPSEQGGRQGPTPDRIFRCIMVIDGVNLDVRLNLDRQGSLQPGMIRDVEINFLNPEFAKFHVRAGEEFQLRETSIIGSRLVKQTFVRQPQRHHA